MYLLKYCINKIKIRSLLQAFFGCEEDSFYKVYIETYMNPVSDYMLANGEDSDKMPQNALFHRFYTVYQDKHGLGER